MKYPAFGLLMSAFLLAGCGGGGGGSTAVPVSGSTPAPGASATPTPLPGATSTPTTAPTVIASASANFTAPPALNQTAPPAPPNTIPAQPTTSKAAALARLPARLTAFRKPSGVRHMLDTASPNPEVRFTTSLGDIDVELRPDVAPLNVANFLSYVNGGAYGSTSFIHRSVPGFIIQGGGYNYSNGTVQAIPQSAAVVNEFHLSNVRGTLAMAKVGDEPNSATNQWFFNTADNSSSLDTQDGGFTVIGSVVTTAGLAVMDAVNNAQIINQGSPFDQLPVVNYSGSGTPGANNFIYAPVTSMAAHPAFFNGEQNTGNGVYTLTFPNGNAFGYYSYLSNENYIYHYDLGYEYVEDAGDGQDGVYLYDFASGGYFYTSPSFPFPYMYDFTLGSVVYYYPSPTNVGHYTTNPRYFYEFKTGQIITK